MRAALLQRLALGARSEIAHHCCTLRRTPNATLKSARAAVIGSAAERSDGAARGVASPVWRHNTHVLTHAHTRHNTTRHRRGTHAKVRYGGSKQARADSQRGSKARNVQNDWRRRTGGHKGSQNREDGRTRLHAIKTRTTQRDAQALAQRSPAEHKAHARTVR